MSRRRKSARAGEPATAGRSASRLPASPPSLPALRTLASRMTGWLCAALLLLNLAVFFPLQHHEFINYDDPQYITENPNIAAGLTAGTLGWALSAGYAFNWHPLTWISHMLDVQLFGLNAGSHHLVSLALHTASTLFLFGFLTWTTAAPAQSAFVAAMFAIHPLHVESVAWAAERKDVLSTLFLAVTLLAYVAYVRKPGGVRYTAVLLFFVLGLMSKPMLVTLPFVLLLLDVWPLRRALHLREKVPLFVLAGVSSVITYVVQQHGGAVAALQALPLRFRVENAIVSYGEYVADMFWPVNLAPFYPYKPLPAPLVAFCAAGLAAATFVAVRAFRRYPYVSVGWFWYVGTLAPVIGIIQVGDQSRADRYTYVPLIGIFILIAWGVPDLLAGWNYRVPVLAAAACLATVICAGVARQQVGYWQNSFTIWTHALNVTTNNDLAHSNLAIAYQEQGDVRDAITHYTASLRIKPDAPASHGNLGVALASQGDVNGAIRELQEAARLKPGEAAYHYNLGLLLQRQGNSADAKQHFEAALRVNPQYQEARRMLNAMTGQNR